MSSKREIMTFSGKMFDFLIPSVDIICIEDIAHHLACVNRYTGATRVPYSVAEHSVRCSYVPVGDPLLNLMHDSAEAYINDIPRPQKKNLGWCRFHIVLEWQWNPYEDIESNILYAIFKKLHIPFPVNFPGGPTKQADDIMMATEVRDLMPPQGFDTFLRLGVIPKDIEPLPHKIEPWAWDKAEREFLRRYKELRECG